MTMAATTASDETRRRVCEARSWLRQGYTTAAKVDELMERIRRHRGDAAASELREEMRRQWSARRTWLESPAQGEA